MLEFESTEESSDLQGLEQWRILDSLAHYCQLVCIAHFAAL